MVEVRRDENLLIAQLWVRANETGGDISPDPGAGFLAGDCLRIVAVVEGGFELQRPEAIDNVVGSLLGTRATSAGEVG